jgi:hypothetical protein
MMQDFECEQRAWQLLVELVVDPLNNDLLQSKSGRDAVQLRSSVSHAPDAIPLPAFQEIERSATGESLAPSRSLNDFLLFGGGRKSTKFQTIPRCLPGHASVVLAKTAETLNVDALLIVKS